MSGFTGDGPAIRVEIDEAHRRLVQHLASPGDHWSAADRTAMSSDTRRARNADPLPPWIAPSSVAELMPDQADLPAAAVDAIWRIANHPGSLTKAWFDSTIAAGIEPSAYVELVAVVAMTVALDDFYRSVGMPAPSIPTATTGPARGPAGDPTVDSHWVPTVPVELPNIRKALSAAPAELEMQGVLLDAQYVPGGALAVDLGETVWSLERTQLELVASRVSSVNECFY